MIKSLMLWQPWATLIAVGKKRVETRSWQPVCNGKPYRGQLFIHAAQRRVRQQEVDELCDRAPTGSLEDENGSIDYMMQAPVGVVVVVCQVKEVLQMTEDLIKQTSDLEKAVGDWSVGRFAWYLDSFQQLAKPVKAKGGQKLWVPSAELVTEVMEGIRQ